MYSPIVDEIAKEYGSKLKVCRINVDENPNISRQFRISAIPASFILKKGKIVKYWFGMEPLQAVKDQLKEILRVARKVKADSSKP
jgi:thioredoxin 1